MSPRRPNWNAVFSAGDTPAPALTRLRDAYAKAAATPEMKSMVEKTGYEPYTGTVDQFATAIRAEAKQLADDYKRLGLKPED